MRPGIPRLDSGANNLYAVSYYPEPEKYYKARTNNKTRRRNYGYHSGRKNMH